MMRLTTIVGLISCSSNYTNNQLLELPRAIVRTAGSECNLNHSLNRKMGGCSGTT